MAIAKTVTILILSFALANFAAALPRARPVQGPDIFKRRHANKDVLLPGEKIYNVMSFGAKPDGVFDSTQAFMTAWQTVCHSPAPGRILVPAGRFLVSSMFFQGPCLSPHPVTLQVEGTVLASADLSEFENGDWLMFQHINGLKIFGGGTFDGQGQSSWQITENCEANNDDSCIRNPSSLFFMDCSNVMVQNIKSLNPKGFHMFVTKCTNVRLRKLKLIAPETSPNTDGIHISSSINVIIARNTIQTGDDCISMIQGSENVFINRLKCGPGHGISIGSLGKYAEEREVKGIRIKNSALIGTTNGLRIKSWPDKYGGAASEISFSNITMENVKNPIIIDQEYQCSPNCQKKPSLVRIRDIHFANVKGTTTSPIAVDFRCSKLYPCMGITLRDIDLKLGTAPTTARCSNIKPVYGLGVVNPPPCI
ncbi:exopolygalacturonase-like [Lotus japonicus]|uniref:exopolygalacturonase-like n=1 Tax=Lotus japonicus TaxID=34305 RepID=UPI002589B53F|nr:exopolygalacturonase-like [Lotus japonicus]